MRRHKVKPGITGWAQVNGLRGATDTLDAMKARVEHDLWYIDNWSLGLDLKIIALTASRLWFDRNAYQGRSAAQNQFCPRSKSGKQGSDAATKAEGPGAVNSARHP